MNVWNRWTSALTRNHPLIGWLGIAAIVTIYDGWALRHDRETLSRYYGRVGPRPVVNALWLGLTWHLIHGDRQLLPANLHAKYRKAHPLWRLHDVVVLKPGCPTPVGLENFVVVSPG